MPRAIRAGSLAVLVLTALAIAIAGCSNQPRLTQPDPSSDTPATGALRAPLDEPAGPVPGTEPGFFPLALGNLWVYRGHDVATSTFFDGRVFRDERRYRERDRLVCVEPIGGRRYVVMRARQVFGGGLEYVEWVRYRQDHDGLFEADVNVNQEPQCDAPTADDDALDAVSEIETSAQRDVEDPDVQAAIARARAEAMARLELVYHMIGAAGVEGAPRGGATPEGPGLDELTRLAYPLHVGARWVIRRDPRFAAVVLAHELLELPVGRRPGFKVRIRSELFGPRDRILFWVSRLGFLKYDFRIVAPITDGDEVLGEFRLRQRRDLARYDLNEPGRSGDPHTAPEPVASEPH